MLVMHLLQDVEANCADYRAERITSTDAMPGMEVTVKCFPHYMAAQGCIDIKRTCFEDRMWSPVRPFNCDPGGDESFGN